MVTETILKPIGNWQITIPLSWREYLGINKKHVRARLEGNKIIIESLEKEDIDWDVRKINLNELNDETVRAIKESEKQYKAWNKEAFLTHDAFWGNV